MIAALEMSKKCRELVRLEHHEGATLCGLLTNPSSSSMDRFSFDRSSKNEEPRFDIARHIRKFLSFQVVFLCRTEAERLFKVLICSCFQALVNAKLRKIDDSEFQSVSDAGLRKTTGGR
jgi:hypothetical protein